MKKPIAVLLLTTVLATLTACGVANVVEDIAENVVSEAQETPIIEEAPIVEEAPIAEEAPITEEAPVVEAVTENSDGMRPDFKAAMDSYEAFYDEYCSFMKKYMENPTDLSLLGEYADMMSKSIEANQKFEAWDESDMNDAELSYYLEVNTRVAQKLLEVTQ